MINNVFKLICSILCQFWRFLCYLWHTIKQEKMPVWLTLFLFFTTAIGTYYGAPIINNQFEKQKLIASYVSKNLDEFNVLSRELIASISIFNNTLQKDKKINKEALDTIRAKISELQMRALELDIIFSEEKEALEIIKNYKKSLSDLGFAIDTASTPEDAKTISLKVIPFANSNIAVMDVLAQKAGLKVLND